MEWRARQTSSAEGNSSDPLWWCPQMCDSKDRATSSCGVGLWKVKMKSETATLVLVNLASIMQRADESLLPGVYKEVGEDLNADPTALGSLTLFRSLVQSLCYPLAAYLATRHNRAHVIALGAFLWAAATFLVAISSTFTQVLPNRLLLLITSFLI